MNGFDANNTMINANQNVCEKIAPVEKGEIHIHILRTDSGLPHNPVIGFLPLLPTNEREQYLRFGSKSRQKEFLLSRLLLRRFLSLYLNRNMKDFRFGFGNKGKPYIEDSRLKFNLSHTDGLIACSFSCNEVGIDVEKMDVRARPNWRLLAKRFFSPKEVEYINSQRKESQSSVFFRLFTMKEAYLKAVGTGLNFPLSGFTVPLPLVEQSRSGRWEFFLKTFDSKDYCLAHVLNNPGNISFKNRFHYWNEESFGISLRTGDFAGQKDVA
jgi:phosphopantetheine--protein transferase-like protein